MYFIKHPNKAFKKSHRRVRGFTLVEMMMAMTVFALALAGLLAAFIFGLREDQLVQSKLGASDEFRRSFQRVAYDIRCANSHAVGNYTSGSFAPIVNGNDQVGNAIRIYISGTNQASVIYFFDTSGTNGTWTLNRLHTGDTSPTVIATNLQNSATFSAEDYTGAVQQTMIDKDVIHFQLDFCQYQFPRTFVGAGHYYDRYTVDFRATPHVPGGR